GTRGKLACLEPRDRHLEPHRHEGANPPVLRRAEQQHLLRRGAVADAARDRERTGRGAAHAAVVADRRRALRRPRALGERRQRLACRSLLVDVQRHGRVARRQDGDSCAGEQHSERECVCGREHGRRHALLLSHSHAQRAGDHPVHILGLTLAAVRLKHRPSSTTTTAMLRRVIACAVLLTPYASLQSQGSGPVSLSYGATAERIVTAALADSGVAWDKLARFTDYSGSRFTGSAALERGIDWVLAEMKKDGLDNVRGEPAMVPHWVRGTESATLVQPRIAKLPMLGLGGSIATPKGGITAEVMVVSNFDELTRRAAEAKGKIVLFDAPFVSYGQTVAYRREGAVAASNAGAVASLIRSVTPYSMRTPHTGQMAYDSTVKKIPHAAITVEDAMMIHRMVSRGEKVVVRLAVEAQRLPDVPSRNAIAEIRGSEKPDEVVVLSGHLDSWDVGQGAMDDADGFVAAWEALNLIRKLGLKPRRTIRVVGWTNEET